MKVYLCFYHRCNGVDEWQSVTKVVDDEIKALEWVDALSPTDEEWRSYAAYEVE